MTVPSHIANRQRSRTRRGTTPTGEGASMGNATIPAGYRVEPVAHPKTGKVRNVLVKDHGSELEQGQRARRGFAKTPAPAGLVTDDGQDLFIGTGQQLAAAAFQFTFQATTSKLLARLAVLSDQRGQLTRLEVLGNSLFASNRLNVAGAVAGFPLLAFSPAIRTDQSNYIGVPTKGGIDMVVAGALAAAGNTTGYIATDLLTERQYSEVEAMRPGQQLGASFLFGFGEVVVPAAVGPVPGVAILEVLAAKPCVLGRLVIESATPLAVGDMLLTDVDVARRRLLSNGTPVDVTLVLPASDDQRGLYIGKALPAGEPATLGFSNTTGGPITICAGCFIDQG